MTRVRPASAELAAAGLRVAVDGPVATITLDRPDKRNAQRPETWLALDGIGRSLDGSIRVVVVRGEGPSFSAGIDLSVLSGQVNGGLPTEATIGGYQEGFAWLGRPDIVSVAAVQGHAIGAGFQLALACDLRVLADDVKLCMRETTLGLVPDLGGTATLVDIVGYPRALEICVTGRRVEAREALALGLGEVVVPRAELDATVTDLVTAVLAAPRDATVETKALLLAARDRPGRRADQLRLEREAQVRRLHDLAGLPTD